MTIASHELALCEINNGGRYKQRCASARLPALVAARRFLAIASRAAVEYEQEFGTPGEHIFTAEDVLLAAAELAEYYARHVTEVDTAFEAQMNAAIVGE